MLQSEASTAGGSGALGAGLFPGFGRGYSGEGKQHIGSSGLAEACGGSGGDGGETLYLKAAGDGN